MDSQILPGNKKSKASDDESDLDSTNCFDQLPHETVVDILSRLPIKPLIQFTFTCQTLNPLTHDRHLVNLHLTRSENNSESSYLIIHSDYPLKNHLYFLQLSDQKVREFNIPFPQSMSEFTIMGSSHGLLCLINSLLTESICIYNPFTRDYFELPESSDLRHQVVIHGFGFDPVARDYKVVKISYCGKAYIRYCRNRGMSVDDLINAKQTSEVKVYSKRSNAWADKGIIPYRLENWSSPGVLVNRRLHWVSGWGMQEGSPRLERLIVSYDLVDDAFRAMKSPCSSRSNALGRCLSNHLSVFNGCLCVSVPVPMGRGSFYIWVMKEYGVEESWTKEYSIGVYQPLSMVTFQMERASRIWRSMFRKKKVKVLCVLESGEVVLEYRGTGLVSYDPCKKTFKELEYEGMPKSYQTTVHVGSLVPANL